MIKRVSYRRKMNGKTNYKKRLKLLISKKPRLVIRKTLNQTIMQIVKYKDEGDQIIISATSSELKNLGWKMNTGNIPAAYLTGLLIGKKAKEHKLNEVILDIGLNTPTKGSKIFSALKGAVDSGINIKYKEEMFPNEDTIKGLKIKEFLDSSKDKLQFGRYKKEKVDPLKNFEEVKVKIIK